MKRLVSVILILLLIVPFILGNTSGTEKSIVDNYDATISYETCLLANGSFYKSYNLSFKDNLVYTENEDGTIIVDNRLVTLTNLLKEELKAYRISFEVNTDDKGNISILEYYEDGYTEMYIDYGYTGYDYFGGESEVEDGFLFTTYIDSDKTIFADENEDLAIRVFVNKLESIASNFVAQDKILKAYIVGTKYLNTYTTDADVEYLDQNRGVVYYYFYVEPDNINRTYTIKNRSINLPVWYVMAIAAGGIVAVITFIAIGRAKKKEIIYG